MDPKIEKDTLTALNVLKAALDSGLKAYGYGHAIGVSEEDLKEHAEDLKSLEKSIVVIKRLGGIG